MIKLYTADGTFLRNVSELEYRELKLESFLSNGDKQLSFLYLGKYTDILPEFYVQTQTDRFVVKEIAPKRGSVEYRCQLCLEGLEDATIRQFTAVDKTIMQAAAAALVGTGWMVEVDPSISSKVRSVQQFHKTPYELLLRIRDAFMCEIRFDSLQKKVIFAEEFGEDRGVYLRPELNLTDVSLTLDSYDYYTRIIPVGDGGLTIESVNSGRDYLENHQYSPKNRTLYWEDTSYSDAQALKEDVARKLEDISKPKKSYSVEVRDLAKLSTDYSLLDFALGDTVTVVDEPTGIKDKQRIVTMTQYPLAPERNSVELSNTVLSWEEYQEKMAAAAAAWEEITNADGNVNGVYVHGVQAGEVVGIEVVVDGETKTNGTAADLGRAVSAAQQDISAITVRVGTVESTYLRATDAQLTYATITNLNATNATVNSLSGDYASFKSTVTGELSAHQAVIDNLDTTYLKAADAEIEYAKIDLANIAAGTIKTAMIDTGAVQTAQIADGSITDAKIVGLTASKITAGTLNAGVIDVVNLNADNITVGTLNGQRIADGAISQEKLTQELSDTIDSAVANTQILYVLSDMCFVNKNSSKGGADEILDQMRSLTGGGHAHVFLRRTAKGCKALHPIRQKLRFCFQRTGISTIFAFNQALG